MKFTILPVLLSLAAFTQAAAIEEPSMKAIRREVLLLERQNANDGRPVTNGACCVAGVSKKQDVCNLNGAQGKCVPANTAGCGEALTCIANADLSCNANQLENGRPLCRLAA